MGANHRAHQLGHEKHRTLEPNRSMRNSQAFTVGDSKDVELVHL